jgi:uncharacterized membrane protein
MTDASSVAAPHAGRGLAFVAYFLLLAAIPTGGVGALLGVVLAYAGRDGAAPLIRSHHRFQIRIFWIGLALLAAAFALGVGAWLGWFHHALQPAPFIPHSPDAQTVAFRPGLQPAFVYSWSYSTDPGRAAVPPRIRLEGYAAVASFVASGLWSILAPLWGLMRLASGRFIGQSAL